MPPAPWRVVVLHAVPSAPGCWAAVHVAGADAGLQVTRAVDHLEAMLTITGGEGTTVATVSERIIGADLFIRVDRPGSGWVEVRRGTRVEASAPWVLTASGGQRVRMQGTLPPRCEVEVDGQPVADATLDEHGQVLQVRASDSGWLPVALGAALGIIELGG